MASRVRREVIIADSFGEQERLAESQCQAFAGDGIGRTRCVSYEGDIAVDYSFQAARGGHRSALPGCSFRMGQPVMK